jgi:hypothetical protein
MVIASATGWPEPYIQWDLPLSRGYAYYLAARIKDGGSFQWPCQTNRFEDWIDNLRQWSITCKSTPRP